MSFSKMIALLDAAATVVQFEFIGLEELNPGDTMLINKTNARGPSNLPRSTPLNVVYADLTLLTLRLKKRPVTRF